MWQLGDPSRIDLSLDSRSISFENPTGARGAGGGAHGGRKGVPSRLFAPGETVTLADIEGPGTIRHIWMTVPPRPPASMRAWRLEVIYDELDEPSVSVPLVDFFGLPHGPPGPLRLGAHGGPGRPRLQRLFSHALRKARASRMHQ